MPIVKKKKAMKDPSGMYYTISVTIDNDPNDTVENVHVDITNTGGQPNSEPTHYILKYSTSMNGMRLFIDDTVNFDGNAVGFEYDMTFTMYDSSGTIIPSPSTGLVAVEEAMMLV